MTVRDWLDARSPAPPPALRARLDAVLRDETRRDARDTADVCLGAAEKLVADLLRTACTTRESALDLLAADALVTYAFEAAAESPVELAARASRAMQRMAALGAVSSGTPAA